MACLYAATGDGIARLDESGDAWTVELFLPASGAQCLAIDPDDPNNVYAGLREGGVRRTQDGGRSWVDCALPEPGVFSLAVSAADGSVYAGTEPSRLFRSNERGESWRELDGLLDLPSRPTWSFPPRPWTSHVRWIEASPHDADLLLVGIELGGLMRSADGGETWQDHRPGAQPDVHSLAWHPRVAGRAYEAGRGRAGLGAHRRVATRSSSCGRSQARRATASGAANVRSERRARPTSRAAPSSERVPRRLGATRASAGRASPWDEPRSPRPASPTPPGRRGRGGLP